MEFPREEQYQDQSLLNQKTIEMFRSYRARGLTKKEVSDLVTLENIERQGITLADAEAARKEIYLAKIKEYETRT